MTKILLINKENCALKLVDEIILYYDAWSKKHKKRIFTCYLRTQPIPVHVATYSMYVNSTVHNTSII